MSQLDDLLRNYTQRLRLPWTAVLAPQQRVWCALYPPEEERRLRMRVAEFELVTRQEGRGWVQIDLTDSFARWMGTHPYHEAYFAEPELLQGAYEDFEERLAGEVRPALEAADPSTVVALLGVGSLYGLTRASALIEQVAPHVQGRLLVFFPGSHVQNNYRLLNARDGWNYHAVPITI